MRVDNFNRKKLWEGCILTTIAHAIMVGEYPELSNEHSWDGINYSVQDSCGCRGTITFHDRYLIAVFQDMNNKKKIEKCIKEGAFRMLDIKQKQIEDIAREEALQYVLEDVNGKTIPLITTGFWGVEDEIFSKEKYQRIEEDGAYIIENHIKRFDENMQGLIEYYDISDELVNLVESIYSRKMMCPDRIIPLLENEKNLLLKTYESNLDECKQSLKEVNIYF